jgi:hypothetical protein
MIKLQLATLAGVPQGVAGHFGQALLKGKQLLVEHLPVGRQLVQCRLQLRDLVGFCFRPATSCRRAVDQLPLRVIDVIVVVAAVVVVRVR